MTLLLLFKWLIFKPMELFMSTLIGLSIICLVTGTIMEYWLFPAMALFLFLIVSTIHYINFLITGERYFE